MLRGISPFLGPDLLATLCRMGHGDEILLADAHFPGHRLGQLVLRADGIRVAQLLAGILPLFALDTYVHSPVAIMSPVAGDSWDLNLIGEYRRIIAEFAPHVTDFESVERFAFYERARSAFAIVMTGETVKYGNLLLRKGVS